MICLKRFLCIFLSVVILLFGVNNSYFSLHKMDNVNAAATTATIATISVATIVKLICAVGITGLGCAVINEWKDLDFESVLNDMHNWLRTTSDPFVQALVDGNNALKEWVSSSEWVVYEGTGGNSNPSPPPNKNDKRGLKNAFKMPDTLDVASLANIIALGSASAYNYFQQDDSIVNICQAYLHDKITNFPTTPAGIDPITDALQARYGDFADNEPYYDGTLDFDFVSGKYTVEFSGSYFYGDAQSSVSGIVEFGSMPFMVGSASDGFSFFCVDDSATNGARPVKVSYIRKYGNREISESKYSIGFPGIQDGVFHFNCPAFATVADARNYIESGDDSACLNKRRKHNYLDPEDEYGWASTAGITPNDLFAATQGLSDMLNGAYVSLNDLDKAINAVKAQLEDLNPNTNPSVAPVPYPTINDYSGIMESVVTDPRIFPQTNPNPNPGVDPHPSAGIDPDPIPGIDPDPVPGVDPDPNPSFKPSLPNIPSGNIKPVADLKYFFPFCIPFDLIHLFEVLVAEPVPPRFEIPFKYDKLGIDYTLVIDFKQFEELAKIFRTGQTLLFVLGLILITRNIIKG